MKNERWLVYHPVARRKKQNNSTLRINSKRLDLVNFVWLPHDRSGIAVVRL